MGTTIISVQGARMSGPERGKRAARLVAVGPEGSIQWVHHSGRELGIVWSYDVDPIEGDRLFVTATRPEQTVVYLLDTRTGNRVWSETLDLVDTHDADLLDRHRILLANMRNYRSGENRDRLLIYNRSTDTVVWEWRFADRYPREAGGNYTDDWTHVNDVDALPENRVLASPRNLDQIIIVNRTTGVIERRLGRDDDYRLLREQHNPMALESTDDRPTILVADSENGRVVEYERRSTGWHRTWRLSGDLAWPRDADRLPNGNTLITDSRNHRVIEVTPRGDVVWEFYAPWLVYDAERVQLGDEPGGPTIRDQGASGEYSVGKDARTADSLRACAFALRNAPPPGTPTSTPSLGSSSQGPSTDQGSGAVAGTTSAPPPNETSDGPDSATPGQPGFGFLVALGGLLLVRLVGANYRV